MVYNAALRALLAATATVHVLVCLARAKYYAAHDKSLRIQYHPFHYDPVVL